MIKQNLEQLCQFNGEEFIQQVYKLVLGRPLDITGKEYYLPLLQSGQLSKEAIIANIRYSAEGNEKKHHIKGINKFYQLNRLQRWAKNKYYLLSALKFIESCWRLPRALRQLQQHENLIHDSILKNQQLTDTNKTQSEKINQLTDTNKAQSEKINQLEESIKKDLQQLNKKFSTNNAYLQSLQNNISNIIEKHLVKPKAPAHSQQAALQTLAIEEQGFLDLMYVAFENQFRGAPQQIKKQMAVYLPLIKACYEKDKPVLDLGCGRGEWLSLLADNNIQAKGIDLNSVMVAEAKNQGLMAQTTEAVSYLKSMPNGSLSAVTGIHLLEHLPFDVLIRLLQETLRVVKKGGIVIFETPNPENIFVGAHFFYTDPTHKNPLVPDTMKFIFEYIGFKQVEIKRLHTYAEVSAAMGKPRNLSDDFKNNHFFNAMDFAIIAKA